MGLGAIPPSHGVYLRACGVAVGPVSIVTQASTFCRRRDGPTGAGLRTPDAFAYHPVPGSEGVLAIASH